MSKYQFDATVVFMAVAGEEQGLLGATQRGYAAVRFTEPNEDFTRQHQKVRVENGIKYGDVVEMVDFAYVARVARINAAAMASMSLAPAAPAGVGFKTGRQEYDTVLAWRPNAEPDVAGYRIVWRETHQPLRAARC